ncbi:hypothetical protein H6F46_18095 [Limnothrix sp. FACHB-1083]|uniref:hypothetical protein n=1 Tax=unclassified Limnothrix TaxID=2632864 RepID=UPI0016814632|nr:MULTISPECIES: hypothetical protein [unclassified Limnothrix]MBD2162603.1 hypothetical protein [Limnothrix sp. FACHB-1083]MBD2193709.1 hypothetical protein [Limnothrix sp. FACHB-1088]
MAIAVGRSTAAPGAIAANRANNPTGLWAVVRVRLVAAGYLPAWAGPDPNHR